MDKDQVMPSPRAGGVLIPLGDSLFLLIGGSDREKAFNDVWILNPKETKWNKISKDNEISKLLTPRIGVAHSVTSKAPFTFYLHGGQDYFTKSFYADMIEVTITVPTKENLGENCLSPIQIKNHTIYPLDVSKVPQQRNSHGMCFNEEKLLYIFGGGCEDKLLNDLWSFDLETKKYEKVEIENIDKVIEPRELFAMGYNKKNNTIVIFGGRLYSSFGDHSYIIDLSTKTCKKGSKMPTGLCAFGYTQLNYKEKDYIITYGGTDGNNFFNSFVIYDMEKDAFRKSKLIINKNLVNNDPSLAVFLGRISTMMTYNEEKKEIVLYGGSASDKEWSYINEVPIEDILKE